MAAEEAQRGRTRKDNGGWCGQPYRHARELLVRLCLGVNFLRAGKGRKNIGGFRGAGNGNN
jgi:hypothetical protein